jgi:hypothetical protein
MKKSNLRYIILWCLIIAVVSMIIIISTKQKNHSLETFTPRLGQIYRPFARRFRIFGEGFYNRTKQNISNLIRSTF